MDRTNGATSVRFRVGTILIYFLSLVLVGSAAVKFAQVPKIVSHFAMLGFEGSKLLLIAGLEVASAILFALPRTRALGLLLVSAYLGGAIATHLGRNEPPFQPAFVLALFWLATLLRHPEVLWSFKQTSA